MVGVILIDLLYHFDHNLGSYIVTCEVVNLPGLIFTRTSDGLHLNLKFTRTDSSRHRRFSPQQHSATAALSTVFQIRARGNRDRLIYPANLPSYFTVNYSVKQ